MAKVSLRNRTALIACRRIRRRIIAARQPHGRAIDPDGLAVDLLMDKADKTARASMILGTRGYAEDGLILARSLASLTIDLNYLSAKDADRFTSYRATGREARKRMAEQCGFAHQMRMLLIGKTCKRVPRDGSREGPSTNALRRQTAYAYTSMPTDTGHPLNIPTRGPS